MGHWFFWSSVLFGLGMVVACQLNIPKEIDVNVHVEQPTNPNTPPPNPIPTTLTYQNIKNLLGGYCVSCHNGPAGKGGVDLTNYQGVIKVVTPGDPDKSPLCDQVKRQLMPPGSPLSDKNIKALCDYVSQGAKES